VFVYIEGVGSINQRSGDLKMEMSAACTAPVSAPISDLDSEHPRFSEYRNYRSAMSSQLVYCISFASWLRQTEEHENGRVIVFQVTSTEAALSPGWYRNVFAPNATHPETFGPFSSESEAS
jgi:hypothetical protein